MNAWSGILAPMLRARRFDETLLQNGDSVPGVFHVSIGLEASAAGLALARRDDDLIMLNHRNHGPLAAIGSDPAVLYAEIYGLDGGPQRGRAGSLHLADADLGVPYTSAMVGGGVGLAVGAGLARKRTGSGGIAFAFFGDGAMGEGAVYESLNLAALWQVPVLFVCESNAEAAGPHANAFQAAGSLLDLAHVHGIPGAWADSRQPRTVVAALGSAAGAVRAGSGPRFLEVRSTPWPGNRTFRPALVTGALDLAAALAQEQSAADPWDDADPVLAEARALLGDGVALAELLALDQDIRERTHQAMRTALQAPFPPESAAYQDVWAD